MPAHSSEFDRFYESYFGDPYMAWHDGLDTQALASLEGEEREEAEQMLIAGLDSGDARPASGLGVLRSKKAVGKLKESLSDSYGDKRIRIARALWEIEEWPPSVKIMVDELKNGSFWGTRLDAARYLGEMKAPSAVPALWEALNDPEGLVRHHAAAALLIIYGIQDESDWQDNPLTIDIMSDDKAEQNKAIAALEKLIDDKGKIGADGS